jgi:hypothetical protein
MKHKWPILSSGPTPLTAKRHSRSSARNPAAARGGDREPLLGRRLSTDYDDVAAH